ncbi:MAG: hypothetical protein IPJ39_16770 [Saprospiraceae bacterium]|nr:hypothetical protein [Saprospiraceae bacterium]
MNNNFFYLLIAFLFLIYLPIAQGQDTLTVEPFTRWRIEFGQNNTWGHI